MLINSRMKSFIYILRNLKCLQIACFLLTKIEKNFFILLLKSYFTLNKTSLGEIGCNPFPNTVS